MISVTHLTKYYGDRLAVDDISFTITQGHVYGFLGPNGAGKSTTMNIITGCLSPSGGTVVIDGHDIFEEPDAAKRCIGYLPEQPPLYMSDSPEDYLTFVGQAKGLRGSQLQEQAEQAILRTGIDPVRHRRISQLSKGYRQRVGIAQALLGNPKVIILDEPTVGLDPIQILEIRELIRELGKTHTVIFSSHILTEVQAICDRILMIAGGRIVAFGEPESLQEKLRGNCRLQAVTDMPETQMQALLAQIPQLDTVTVQAENGRVRLTATIRQGHSDLATEALFRGVAESGYVLYELTVQRGSLEDVFLELSEENTPENNPEKEDEESDSHLEA